jgi:Fe-S-cluster containining protein
MSEAVAQFRELLRRIDGEGARLVEMHCKHVTCKAGCHDCCTDFSVSAVEYAAILEQMRAAGVKAEDLPYDPAAACAFLKEGLCSIYRFRPLICRTHGLPVAFVDDEGERPGMSVSFCPKNFTEASEEELDFGAENTLDLEELNGELGEINLRFLAETNAVEGYRRVPLRQLREDLARQDGAE